jgi:S-layer homology domain/Mannosyl-glycoprotein endo-beta-N-acetylglucosaminidase
MLVSFRTMKKRLSKPTGLLVVAILAAVAALLLQPQPAAAQAAGFSDVSSSNPYRVQIETLAQLGIISGYSDGTFHPNAPVSRQQFAKMVILAMRIGVSEADQSSFLDVQKTNGGTLYPDNYIAAAAREGIVTGYPGASGPTFRPAASVTLAQLVTMGTRAATRPLVVPPDSYRSAWGNFDKVHSVIARVAQYNGLLRDLAPPGTALKSMSPFRAATRAEAAALLFNMMGTDTAGLNGRFLGDSTDLVRYFRQHSGGSDGKFSVPLETLAKLYVIYGKRFGIRADMAWAQMIHETGYGQYSGVVAPEQNNLAGIGATGPGVPGNSFATAELGVIAQYAHLAWYIYPDDLPDPYCVLVTQPLDGPITTPGDPRHFVQPDGSTHKGNVRTVYELSGKWAVGPDYGAAIQNIAGGINLTVGLW